MTDQRWEVVWKIFKEVRELSEGDQSAALAAAPLAPDLREEVLALLEQSTFVSGVRSFPHASVPELEYSPGTEFGRYVIVGLAGEGGFGRVYAARDKDLRRSVAVKVMAAKLAGHGERLIEEARAASALNHPNIVTVHETIEIEGRLAMVMEFVQGQSLRKAIQSAARPFPLTQTLEIGRQIAQALESAHSAGIAHRDVKPENILLRPDGYVKLVDFGLAVNLSPEEPDGLRNFTGTLRYMAPEQLEGEGSTARSDIFSFGLVLYEMVAGAHPFPGETPLDTAEAIGEKAAVAPSRLNAAVPDKLDRLILAMLSKDPASRPSAAHVAKALAGISIRPARVRPAWMVLTVVMLALVVLAVWRTWSHQRPPAMSLKTTPLTGNEGREGRPSISPDGRFVVYEWQERLDGPAKTVVREIGSESSTILPIQGPFTWTPGGDRIGFIRNDTLLTVPRNGGAEEKVLDAKTLTHAEWSPDGKAVVYSAQIGEEDRQAALFVFTPATGKNRQITFPPAGWPGDEFSAVSPDGRRMAFRRRAGIARSDIYVTDFPWPGRVRQLSFTHSGGGVIAWLRDGSGVVTSTFHGANSNLWYYPVTSSAPPTRLTGLGLEANHVQAATAMNRLVWANALDDTNIWRMPAKGGEPVRLVASQMRDGDVAASSSGMLAFRSDRSGNSEIWISGPDGESQKRVTSFEGSAGSPRWSPDGRRIAFDLRLGDSYSDIYTMDCEAGRGACGKSVQRTNHPAADALPDWSRDGAFLYFASLRSGSWQLWRMPSGGGDRDAVQLTREGGFFAMESEDGKWLYYSRVDSPATTGIWRKPLRSRIPFDTPGDLVLPLAFGSTATWSLCGEEIYYPTLGPASGPTEIVAFNIKTRHMRVVHQARSAPIARGLAVSSDGKWVYFSRTDRSESNIVYADYELVK